MATSYDTRALTWTPSRQEINEFKARMRATGDPRWRSTQPFARWLVVALAMIIISSVTMAMLPTAAGIIKRLLVEGWSSSEFAIRWLLPFVMIPITFIILLTRVRFRGSGKVWSRHLRLFKFAQTNGMSYSPKSDSPGYPGLIFGIGHSRSTVSHVYSNSPIADVGAHQFSTGSGKDQRTYSWQFAAIRLEAPLPHIVLDARANNNFSSNLPVSFRRNQRLVLTGELTKHFDVYSPEEYGADAFYIFSPDLIAQLIDTTRSYDVEIVDDWMFLYSDDQLPVDDAQTWQRLASIYDLVAEKIRQRSLNYQDRRAQTRAVGGGVAGVTGSTGDAGVSQPGPTTQRIAPQGRRLRRGFRRTTLATFAIFVVWMFWEPIIAWIRALVP